MENNLRRLSISCVVPLLVISGSLASYSNGASRFSEFRGCNESSPLPLTQHDEAPTEASSTSSSSSPPVQSSTAYYPPNDYFKPTILLPNKLNYPIPSSNSLDGGNRMNVISFGNNRFTNAYGGDEMKEDKVPTMSPAVSRLAQFRHSMQSYRNQITGNRFFEMNDNVKFALFTRNHPSNAQKIQLHDRSSIEASDFKADKPTKLIIHGFSDVGALGEWVTNIKDAYLATSEANVIIADFSSFETFLLFWTNLPVFASKRIADLVTFLELTAGAPRESFHLIARSWGTHVAGVTGRLLQGRVGRITGLEPEARVYGSVLPDYKLISSDAQFVDIVHVNGRRYFFHGSRFGLTPPSGHVDIYPNYSERSSGCATQYGRQSGDTGRLQAGFCQRGRGVTYFTDSIKYPQSHQMCQCPSFTQYKSGNCGCVKENSNHYLGEYLSNKTRGVFQLTKTNIQNPAATWLRYFRMFH
ncbi:Pancreatic triacylglycerol lipase [Orchesella cincta]|uniref:Pancreatic triacylglycerol lipase n=1 Tax=Orchesella cincta TaxID=48709 RepID=A0A1D2N968_ORCCI|nr:Pancreatic triacylglycerol lipase [Orchesella cincta]